MMASHSLALAIREARVRNGWTQAELAARLGVSQGTISFWENGVEVPTLENVIRLALELPELIESFQGRERELLQRVLRLERELFAGKCACKGCSCDTQVTEQPTTRRETMQTVEQLESNRRTMKIAIAGKGGVGKTTIAGTLARLLARDHQAVLALDADSNPNLAVSLGIPTDQAEHVPAVQSGLAEWREDEQGNAYVHLRQSLPQLMANYGKSAPDGVQLLVMGEVLEASVGCRCEAHAVARGITHHLVEEAGVIVLDMEAGLEHLGRGTTEHVDLLLIVVEPYYRALMTGAKVQELAEQLGLPHIAVVANRVRSAAEREAVEQFCQNHDLDLIAVIPFDEAMVAAETAGVAPVDYAPGSPAVQAIDNLATAIRARLT
ncbi:MAG: helix-turn-helix domain-containing protein [Chloroflexota bacterium]|nr:helix-turn-helix domain-containing protein [Chloroflexota bacterium]